MRRLFLVGANTRYDFCVFQIGSGRLNRENGKCLPPEFSRLLIRIMIIYSFDFTFYDRNFDLEDKTIKQLCWLRMASLLHPRIDFTPPRPHYMHKRASNIACLKSGSKNMFINCCNLEFRQSD